MQGLYVVASGDLDTAGVHSGHAAPMSLSET